MADSPETIEALCGLIEDFLQNIRDTAKDGDTDAVVSLNARLYPLVAGLSEAVPATPIECARMTRAAGYLMDYRTYRLVHFEPMFELQILGNVHAYYVETVISDPWSEKEPTSLVDGDSVTGRAKMH